MTSSALDIAHQLEVTPDLLRNNWCVPRETGRFLHLLALNTPGARICEVGTSIGYSTLWLAMAAQTNGGAVDTLEYFESRQELAKQNIESAGLSGVVHFHLGQAIDLLKQFQAQQAQFDFAFIDAAKKEYIDYIQLLEPMLTPGAYVVADNTRSHRDEMLDFLAYMEASPSFDIAELETPNGQLVARKR